MLFILFDPILVHFGIQKLGSKYNGKHIALICKNLCNLIDFRIKSDQNANLPIYEIWISDDKLNEEKQSKIWYLSTIHGNFGTVKGLVVKLGPFLLY